MAINKVEINGEVKLDLTQDTVAEDTLLNGVTAHDAAGNPIEGKVVTTPVPKTSNLLKGDGQGGVTAAVPGTDYLKTAPVTSINGKTGAVTLGKSDVGLGSVDNVKQYSATNPPPYPVTSVNGQTGDVNLTASDIGAVPTSRTVNGKALSANITLAASDVGALPSNTHIPSTVAEMSDAGNYALKSDKVSKSGDTMTGKLTVPQVETGDGNSNFFQCRKFRGEGDANTYYHAIDFGYKSHDKVDFHEYGGIWNFFKNTSGKANEGSLCGKITTHGWEGGAKLTGSPTAPTPGTSDNSTRIATTAFVNSFNSTKLESNGDGSNVTAAFTAASSRTNIATGEKLSVLFGKIAKWLSDLGSLAFKSTVAKTDLASDVQTSLGKADSALQSVTKSDVGLGNVDNVKQYSASNPPPYPVTSVNGKTGAVTIREVPAVTTSDNGKFLRVVNGAWAAVKVSNANGVSF